MRLCIEQKVKGKEKAKERPFLMDRQGLDLFISLLPISPTDPCVRLCNRYVPRTITGLGDVMNTVHKSLLLRAQSGDANHHVNTEP